MRHVLLYYRNAALPPEARIFLWQWMRTIGLEDATNESLRGLCKRLAMTVKKGSRALAQLKECGAINATKHPPPQATKAPDTHAKGGRPRTWHCVSKDMQAKLKAINRQPVMTRMLDKRISFAASSGDGMRDGEARKKTLTLANSWLLVVLLAHMDHAGQVTTLSYVDLMALTGMSRSRLQSQIKKLSAMGILHHQPGALDDILEQRPCSIFTLNLHHPQIQYAQRPTWRIVFLDKKNRGSGGKNNHAVNGLVDAACVLACEARKRGGINSMLPTALPRGKVAKKREPQHLSIERDVRRMLVGVSPWRDFHRLPVRPWQADWLRVYVHRYTCWLLSQNCPDHRSIKARLYRQVRQDFPRAAIHDIKAITTLAYTLAKQLYPVVGHALSSIKDARLDDLALTPVVQDNVVDWQLSGRWHDNLTNQLYTTVFVSLETVGSDFADWLKRRASG